MTRPLRTAPRAPEVSVVSVTSFSVLCSACGVVSYPRPGSSEAARRREAERLAEEHGRLRHGEDGPHVHRWGAWLPVTSRDEVRQCLEGDCQETETRP